MTYLHQRVTAEGHNGQIVFDGASITIARKGFRARTTIGKGEKRIPVGAVNAVQWKPAGALVNGFIQFETAGVGGTRSAYGRQTTAAVRDENSVVFTRKQQASFEQLRQAVERAIATGAAPVNAAVSVSDELTKLAGLLQQGLVTQREFDQQKARLLDGP